MTAEQKREIEKKLDLLDENVENTNEKKGIIFTLFVLGYRVRITENGYEIKQK